MSQIVRFKKLDGAVRRFEVCESRKNEEGRTTCAHPGEAYDLCALIDHPCVDIGVFPACNRAGVVFKEVTE